MITVYIWQYDEKDEYGHASLEIRDNPQIENTYISFYPKELLKFGRVEKVQGILEVIPGVDARLVKSREKDVEVKGRSHDASISLGTLNELAVVEHWKYFSNEKTKYHALFRNCSTIVAHLLAVGWVMSVSPYRKDGSLDEELIRKTMSFLKDIAHRVDDKVIRPPISISNLNTKTQARYNFYHTYIKSPVNFLRRKNPLLRMARRALNMASPPFATVSTIVVLMTAHFDKISWDPHLVHSVALFLEAEEEKSAEDIEQSYIQKIKRTPDEYGTSEIVQDAIYDLVFDGVIHVVQSFIDQFRGDLSLREQLRVYNIVSHFVIQELEISVPKALSSVLHLLEADEDVISYVSSTTGLQIAKTLSSEVVELIGAIRITYHHNSALKVINSTVEIFTVDNGNLVRHAHSEKLGWESLPHDIRRELMMNRKDCAVILYPTKE
jgi:hypothetical protein